MIIKKNWQRLKIFLKKLVIKEHSAKKVAVAFCHGVYVAFSPFPGFHTIMVFALSWLCSLNAAIVLTVSCLINNPWTMIFIYAGDYIFGNWLTCKLFGHNLLNLNPSWMNLIDQWLCQKLGMPSISLASFLIGGNVLGIGISLLLYPPMKHIFSTIAKKRYRQ